MGEQATVVGSPRIFAQGFVFGESPRWHDGRLWMSDLFGGRVLTVDAQGRLEPVVEMPNKPSGLGWLPDGTLLIVSMKDASLLALRNGSLEKYADLSLSRGSPNDMLIDSKGRAYVGNTGSNLFAREPPQPTNLLLVEGGRTRVVADGLHVPNGMVITADGGTLIVAETTGHRLTAFDIDPRDGSLYGRRVYAEMGTRTPDGLSLDAEGAIWVGSPFTSEFIRVYEGGRVTDVVPAGGHFSTACVIGGADRRTLFMVIADWRFELPWEASRGRLETIELSVPGAGLQ